MCRLSHASTNMERASMGPPRRCTRSCSGCAYARGCGYLFTCRTEQCPLRVAMKSQQTCRFPACFPTNIGPRPILTRAVLPDRSMRPHVSHDHRTNGSPSARVILPFLPVPRWGSYGRSGRLVHSPGHSRYGSTHRRIQRGHTRSIHT